eukprot:TRINITY_DN3212_c0_g1_i1.p1 TRINITY_DN3212_c0_g1~~TRINITY_DN3212_c0_g1_i1.p1  ORF type:complete len:188 (+),score=56.77 TRINITY_DN3212_c0_g1_i1:134-697(+)
MASSTKKTVLVPIANGSEDIESVSIIDVLRRAGAEVTVASIEKEKQVTLARGTRVIADALLEEVHGKEFDLIALPGGMPGAEHLRDSQTLVSLLKKQKEEGKLLAAVCASPAVVFQTHKLIEDLPATCHPNFQKNLSHHVDERVVVSKNVITSQGPGTSIEFAVKLVELLYGKEHADGVAKPMIIKW